MLYLVSQLAPEEFFLQVYPAKCAAAARGNPHEVRFILTRLEDESLGEASTQEEPSRGIRRQSQSGKEKAERCVTPVSTLADELEHCVGLQRFCLVATITPSGISQHLFSIRDTATSVWIHDGNVFVDFQH